jgi:OOP family OmpA-OmpF porin
MRFSRLMVACTALLVVSACAGTGGGFLSAEGDIRTAQTLRASAPFNEALRTGYLELAQAGARQADWIDAGIFARKAVRAGHDEAVLPEELANWNVGATSGRFGTASDPALLGELTTARGELMSALDGNARSNAPETAAEAQVMFDCWVEKSESVYWLVPDCKERFDAAMAQLTGRPMPAPPPAPMEPPARDYLVFFDFDRSDLRPDAISILGDVVGAFNQLGAPSITAIGHTDLAGPASYNQRLSERRAASVRDYLVGQGIPAGDISTSGRGQTDPRVPTPDGVREQENRRVEIRLN